MILFNLGSENVKEPRGVSVLHFVFSGPVLLGCFVVYPVLPVFDSMFVKVFDEGVAVDAGTLVAFVPFVP